MKRIVSIALALLLALSVAAASAERVRVGMPWIGEVKASVRQKKAKPYVDAVKKAGGEAVYLDRVTDEAGARAALAAVDCVIFPGGEDIDPSYYGQSPMPALEKVNAPRDASDYWLARAALDDGMPVLAICRGCQLINVVCGGTLYQDIPSQLDGAVEHRDPRKKKYARHDIDVADGGSLMARALGGAGSYAVNSWHHQGVMDVGEGLIVTARTSDGLPEALELARPGGFMLAVQFHPEQHVAKGETQFLSFFTLLVDAARAIMDETGGIEQ